MSILVLGGTGATGSLLIRELLSRKCNVKAIVRSPDKFPEVMRKDPRLALIHAGIADLSDREIESHTKGCDVIALCLGHKVSLGGIYGKPLMLVSDAVRRLCVAIKANASGPIVRFVLMNSAGVRNHDIDEKVSLPQRCVFGIIRALLPPHLDNEKAADYLRTQIGQDDGRIQWSVIRPDSLVNASDVTEYATYTSPIRSTIFDPGQTSRINVAHFMADLITEDSSWIKWKGQMPVIYNIKPIVCSEPAPVSTKGDAPNAEQ